MAAETLPKMTIEEFSTNELEAEVHRRTTPQRFTLVLTPGFNRTRLLDQMEEQDIDLSDEAWEMASNFFDEIEVDFEVDIKGHVWQL